MLHEPIEIAPQRSRGRGILDLANPLPDGWEDGVTFRGIGCTEPEILGPCDIGDSTESRPEAASIFEPVFIRQSAACAIMSKIGSIDMADIRLRSTTEWALGRTLAIGIDSSNPSLADAELIHASTATNAADGAVGAVSCLEQSAAAVGFGADVVLHAPPLAAGILAYTSLNIGGFSPMGHPWLFSDGYPVVAGAETTTITIWATGPIWAAVTEAQPLIDGSTGRVPTGWRTNLDATFSQRLGMAVFDPCLNLSATFTVPACIGGS